MADGTIPIYHGVEAVGEVRWTGVLSRGTWRFHARATLPDARRRQLEAAIAALPADRRDLRALTCWGPDGRTPGWRGFAGVVGALERALPDLGLRVDRNAVRWVRRLGPPAPPAAGAPAPAAEAAAAADAQAADTWALLDLQDWIARRKKTIDQTSAEG